MYIVARRGMKIQGLRASGFILGLPWNIIYEQSRGTPVLEIPCLTELKVERLKCYSTCILRC